MQPQDALEIDKDSKDDEDGEEGKKEVTITMTQLELIISELKTRHIAEKRMMQCDLSLQKKTIQKLTKKIKEQQKEAKKLDIWMLQIKKLSQVNKAYKEDVARLQKENFQLANQFGKVKKLMFEYENEAIYREVE